MTNSPLGENVGIGENKIHRGLVRVLLLLKVIE